MGECKLGQCGGGYILDGRMVGCGAAFVTIVEMYRCADCDVAFHKHCLRKHFAKGSYTVDVVREANRAGYEQGLVHGRAQGALAAAALAEAARATVEQFTDYTDDENGERVIDAPCGCCADEAEDYAGRTLHDPDCSIGTLDAALRALSRSGEEPGSGAGEGGDRG